MIEQCNEKKGCKKGCLELIATILLALFTFVTGLIIGAIFSIAILISLPAIIVLDIILLLLLILTVIFIICNKKRRPKINDCY